MTGRTKYAPRMTAISAAAFAALLLAGCSSGHVGEEWQCPLAAGGSCASVAAADPAVPKTDTAPARTSGQPIRLLPREWNADLADATAAPGTAIRSCETECGFDPFGWLARLFGTEDAEKAETATPTNATAGSPPAAPKPEPAAAAPTDHEIGADDLRTGETVARIWIAPFVDADGIYREASHVRVVLEPAGWRLK